MQTSELIEPEQDGLLDDLDITTELSDYALNVAVVCEDDHTRRWAEKVSRLVERLVGEACLRTSTWMVSHLTHPRFLPEAVRAAVLADVIIVSLRASEEVPVELSVWCDIWLPRRPPQWGALMALVSGADSPSAAHLPTQAYLRAVAGKARLQYLVRARKVLEHLVEAPLTRLAKRSHPAAQLRGGFVSMAAGIWSDWGINE
jgi:hypothetical protein